MNTPSPLVPDPAFNQGQVAVPARRSSKLTVWIVAGLAIVMIAVLFALFSNSEVSKLAFEGAQANPAVKQRLGEPIKRGFLTSGKIEISGPSGNADIAIPISGPNGKATVYAVATKSAGLWTLNVLQVEFADNRERVDLLKPAGDASQTPKP